MHIKKQDIEDFKVYGILSCQEAEGNLLLRQVEELVSYHLQLKPFFDAIKDIMRDNFNIDINEARCKIDIQIVYKAFDHMEFIKKLKDDKFLNQRTTESNVKNCKVGLLLVLKNLLSMKDINMALNTFFLQELDHLTKGLPFDKEVLNGLLWKFNKVISRDILEIWMQKAEPFLEQKSGQRKIIQSHEFLFLIPNCVERLEYFKKTPALVLDRQKDLKFQRIFKIDSKNYNLDYCKNPDERIQNYMKYQYDSNKMIFEGRPSKEEKIRDQNNSKRKLVFEQFKKSKQNNFKSEFNKLLSDMQLYQEIQIAKKNAKRIINQAKLNGQRQHKNQNTETDYEENQNTTGPNNFITQYPDAKYYINPPQKSSQTLLQQQQSNKNLTKIEQLRQNDTYQKKQRQRPISAAILSIKEEVKVHREMMNDPKFNTLMKKKTAQKLDTGIKGSMRRISSAQTNFHLKQNQSQNKTLKTKNSQPNLLKLRPQTALSNQKFPQNQLTQTQSVKNVVNSVKQNYDAWNLKKTLSPPNTINIYSLDKEKEIADNSKGWNFSSKLYKPSNIVKTKMQRKTSMDDLNLKNSALFFDDVLDDKISQWESKQDTNEKLEVFVPYGNVKQTNYHVNVPWSASTRNVSTYK